MTGTHHSLSCRANARHLNVKRSFTSFSITGTHHSLSCRAHARHLNAWRCFTAFSKTSTQGCDNFLMHHPLSCRANARHLNARRCFTLFSKTSTQFAIVPHTRFETEHVYSKQSGGDFTPKRATYKPLKNLATH